MPLSQFHQILPKGTHETAQTKMATYSPDLSPFMPDQEYVELLWENGQVVMQGQSNRMKKSSFADTLPSHTGRFQERDCRNAVNPKSGHFGASTDSAANDFAHSVPSAPVGLNSQVDEMAPWINYQMEDSLQNDYCSDFLSEFSAAILSPFPAHNNAVPADRSTGITHIIRDSYSDEHEHAPKTLPGGSESSRIRTDQLFQLPQSSLLNARSKASECGISTSTHLGSCENLQDKSLQKKDVINSKLPNASTSLRLTNFPHFLRPVALVRSNIQTVDRLRSNEKASTTNSSNNPVASTVINTAGDGYLNHLSEKQGQSTPAPPTVELKKSAKPLHEVISVGKPDAGCRDDTSTNKHFSVVSNANTRPSEQINCQTSAAMTPIRHEVEKNPEAVVASSVCSVNSVGAESNDHKQTTKRKNQEIEESGYQSEDLEDESVGLKKLANARSMNAKRSRAAEVHNLSERRRRDRINEKMRALQELIPNCNKVDKASMLDEAIEYLKTLQLQVQFMSMGSGLCMPPMMLPAAMQHLRPHPMTHFSPMGISMGMGMGFGYGMGMVDVNGASGCPLIPVPPMHHGPQFPCSSVPGAPILHGIPGPTSLPMFGMPGQGIPMPMPRAPFGSLSGHHAKVLPTATGPLPTADVAPLTNSVDQDQHDVKRETNPCALNSQILTSTQMNNQVVHTSGN